MKKLISNSGGYQLYVELKLIPAMKNKQHELRFTTKYEHAKDPDDEQLKFQLILDDEALENLKEIIGDY